MPDPVSLRRLMKRIAAAALLPLCFIAGSSAQQAAPEAEAIDPPGRVGGISLIAGPVSLVDLSSGSREEALLNWPVTAGWRVETGPTGRAEVRIGSTVLRLDDETTVDFVRLDDHFMQIAVLRGAVSLRLRNREILSELEVLTQRERMVFDDLGRYRIDVDRGAGITAVTAFAGRVRIASGDNLFVVAAGQRGEVSAPPLVRFQLTAAAIDRLDEWAAARDAREDAIRSSGHVSRETTGVEALDEYGDWRTVEDYGAVWFPRSVPDAWAPYRYGRWASVSPWGWTWIDEAPWGFAPLHYGRWVVVGGAWGWVPGIVVARPVYAPALVAWYSAPGVGVGAPVGWFPLGPREPYVPAYRHTPRYLRVVNVQHVPNVAPVTIVQAPKYVNRHPDRSTWVPDDRFGRPEPVNRGQRPPPSEWRQYIARPQPPANVPNTKRRQWAEGVVPGTLPASPALPADARSGARPPTAVPRAGEGLRPGETRRAGDAPRAVAAPRSIETPQPQPWPSSPPALQEPARGRGERPAREHADRRTAPRAPNASAQTSPQARPSPAPQPTPAIAVPPHGVSPAPVQPPAAQTPIQPGRSDAASAARDGRRYSPRGPEVTPAPAPAPPLAPQPLAAPPVADVVREAPASRSAPPARNDGGSERSAPRPGRPPAEMAR